MCYWVSSRKDRHHILSFISTKLTLHLPVLCMNVVGKGLNPDDFIEEEEVFVQTQAPTLEEKLANATLKEIDELEVSE